MRLVDCGWQSRLRRALLATMFWAGLLICAAAVIRFWAESRSLVEGLGALGLGGVILAMVAAWGLAVASWQHMVVAHDGQSIRYAVAARHLALLLLGKYLPGGVWGFVARLSDSSTQRPLASMFAAGMSEQWLGLVSMFLLAGCGFAAAYAGQPSWMLLSLLTPLAAVFSLSILYWTLRRLHRVLPQRWHGSLLAMPQGRQVFSAAMLTTVQQALVLLVVGSVAASAFSLGGTTALAVAGSYGLAVVVGILVVFVPGGILVREAVFVWLASRWLAPAEAIAIGAVLRLLFTAFDLSAGLLAGGLHLRRA